MSSQNFSWNLFRHQIKITNIDYNNLNYGYNVTNSVELVIIAIFNSFEEQ